MLQLTTNIAALRAITPSAGDSAIVQAHTSLPDCGGGIFHATAIAAPGTYVDNNGTIIVPGDGSIAWVRQTDGGVNAAWFGAYGDYDYTTDTGTDNTAAITAALDYAKSLIGSNGHYYDSGVGVDVLLPAPGDYLVSDALTITGHYVGLRGHGGKPWIISNSATANVIELAAAKTGASVRDIRISKSVTATAGAGVTQLGVTNLNRIENVEVRECYDGFTLSSVGWATLCNCEAFDNIRDGFVLTGDKNNTQLQWYIDGNNLAQGNGRYGLFITGDTTGAATQWTLGHISGFNTAGNTTAGIRVEGFEAKPIHGFKLSQSFIGNDGGHGIHLNTYGRYHSVVNCFIELAAKHGLYASGDNELLIVAGSHFRANGWNGVDSAASQTVVDGGCVFASNGTATAGASVQKGCAIKGANSTINGCQATNFGGMTSQLYGVSVEALYCNVVGSNLAGNMSAPVLYASPATQANTVYTGNVSS